MASITANTSFTLTKGQLIVFDLGGSGTVNIDGNYYTIGRQEAYIGPFTKDVLVQITVTNSPITYRIEGDGSLENKIIVSADDPNDSDGRADGTIWLKVTP